MLRILDKAHSALTNKYVVMASVLATMLLGALTIFLRKPYFAFAGFAILAMAFLTLAHKERTLVVIYTLFYSAYLTTFFSTLGSLALFVVLWHLALTLFEQRRRMRAFLQSITFPLSLLILLTVYCLISFLINRKASVIPSFTFALYFAFPLFLCSEHVEKPTFEKAAFAGLIGLLANSFVALGMFLLPITKEALITFVGDGRFADVTTSLWNFRFSGLIIDPNEYGLLIIIATAAPLMNLYKIKHKVILGVLCLLLVGLGLLSRSKSYLICLVILVICFLTKFIFSLRSKSAAWGTLIVGLVSVSMCGVLLFTGTKHIQSIFGRFIENNYSGDLLDNITTGRATLWATYMADLTSHPLALMFGYGIRATYSYQLPLINVSHNYYINLLWDLGLLGTLFFALFVCSVFGYAIKNQNRQQQALPNLVLPAALFLIDAFSLTLTANVEPMLFLSISVVLIADATPAQSIFRKAKESPYVVHDLPVDTFVI